VRVLFCGDRDWTDPRPIRLAFDQREVTVCIVGGARGADTLAEDEARDRGITVERYDAEWEKYGRAAGPIRNQRMLDEGQPDEVVAFHPNLSASKGTADMVRRTKKYGVPVEVVSE